MVEVSKQRMNQLGRARTAFLFILDFELQRPLVFPLTEAGDNGIFFSIDDTFLKISNLGKQTSSHLSPLQLIKRPIPFTRYFSAFEFVKYNIEKGNSFLTNLTAETEIESNWSLDTIFDHCMAKYKVCLKDRFVCFSPETFVQIDEAGRMASFPMKGTAEAQLAYAEELIMSDAKELFEHTTIVDLIRNDLSRVADKVWVERFRYVDIIRRHDGSELLQVSSEVCGQLPACWHESIGDLLFDLLPAGSISGAPKPKTLEIIREAERFTYLDQGRGYYSGVFGVFDGYRLSSAVMIRFIEKRATGLVFKSGGGITSMSSPEKEFDELLSKIYVPIL